jgi:hypothetical protein
LFGLVTVVTYIVLLIFVVDPVVPDWARTLFGSLFVPVSIYAFSWIAFPGAAGQKLILMNLAWILSYVGYFVQNADSIMYPGETYPWALLYGVYVAMVASTAIGVTYWVNDYLRRRRTD